MKYVTQHIILYLSDIQCYKNDNDVFLCSDFLTKSNFCVVNYLWFHYKCIYICNAFKQISNHLNTNYRIYFTNN